MLDPILADIPVRPTTHAGPIRNVATSTELDEPLQQFKYTIQIPHDAIRTTNIDVFISQLYLMGEQKRDQLGKALIRTLVATTKAEGNVINANGKPLSWELVLELLDAIELHFSDDGALLSKPTVLMNPNDGAKLEKIPKPDDLQEQIDGIIDGKREKHFAEKRSRRLS